MVVATVTEVQARDYEKQAWHLGCGIKPILDNTTMRFATDFANVCIKSLITSLYGEIRNQVIAEIRTVAQKKQAEQTGSMEIVASQGGAQQAAVPPARSEKGRIILTD